MLEVISNGFNKALERLKGRVELTETNIEDALGDIRLSLLEADVNIGVVREFITNIKEKAIGEIVDTRVAHKGRKVKVSPGDHFINICHEELVALMGDGDSEISYSSRPLSIIMLIGLQGCGKTTTAGKIAQYLRKKGGNPLLVAADPYRPAAVDQLQTLGNSLNIPVFFKPDTPPPELCRQAIEYGRQNGLDTAIFDTAGRLAIDDTLMKELQEIKRNTSPENIFMVCDAMIGQDAVKTADQFNSLLDVSGFILTKLDGDARGGAALSIKKITGKPIKFIGTGESLDRLEEFRPEGLASRILGFGDVVGLMKDFEDVVDEKKAEEDAMRMLKGKFTMVDFLEQIQSIKKMGPLQDLIEKIPMLSKMTGGASVDDTEMVKVEAIINSMTAKERLNPDLIHESRKQRIAKGSGRKVKEVTDILKRFSKMRDMMKNMGKSGMLDKFSSGLTGMPGMGNSPEIGLNSSLLPGSTAMPKAFSKDAKKKLKQKRKQAKQARKKGKKR